MVYTTDLPSGAPTSFATRWARVCAATRLGWVHTTVKPSSHHPFSNRYWGICVDCGVYVYYVNVMWSEWGRFFIHSWRVHVMCSPFLNQFLPQRQSRNNVQVHIRVGSCALISVDIVSAAIKMLFGNWREWTTLRYKWMRWFRLFLEKQMGMVSRNHSFLLFSCGCGNSLLNGRMNSSCFVVPIAMAWRRQYRVLFELINGLWCWNPVVKLWIKSNNWNYKDLSSTVIYVSSKIFFTKNANSDNNSVSCNWSKRYAIGIVARNDC